MKQKVRTQTRIVGFQRRPMGTAVIKEIERKVKEEMRVWNVSRSFVIANALSFVFNVEMENYKKPQLVKARRRA